MNKELNNWEKFKIIHKNKIKEFNFLMKNDLIIHIESDYYYAVEDINNAYFKAKCAELNLTDGVEKEIQIFIKKLNEYNELKDCADSLIGKIAEFKGVRIKEIRDEVETPE